MDAVAPTATPDRAKATLRADAQRNRARVLEAAERLLAERGLDVSMHEIASAAGVGVGTIFRRFPTKDDLVATVVAERLRALATLARACVERSEHEPWAAFAGYFEAAAEQHVRHRGLIEAIGSEHLAHPMHAEQMASLIGDVATLVERALAAGELRAGVTVADIPMLLCAVGRMGQAPSGGDVGEAWRRPCTILLDGMRASAATVQLAPGADWSNTCC